MGWVLTARDYQAIAQQYCSDVIAGRIPACKWVVAACQRQVSDLGSQGGESFPYAYEPKLGERVCRFVENLHHTKGEWARNRQRITLEAWQVFVIMTTFSWWGLNTGYRRFRDVYVEVPRKNAKSTLTSGIALYMLLADGEPGAEVCSAATTKQQARIVFDDSRRMCKMDSAMVERFGLDVQQHALLVEDTGSKYVPLSAEGSTLDGLNVHFAPIDELHAHKTRAVYDVIDSGRGSRNQPMIWAITTAGTDRSGICYERRTHVTKVLGNVFKDETCFGIIYTIDDGDDWADPACWRKANPNYGVSVLAHDMHAAARYALSMASKQPEFLTKRLNVWVNADSAWMDMRAWDAAADKDLTLQQFAGADCLVGLDLASKVDIAAKVYLFEKEGTLYLFGSYWLPERAVENSVNSQYEGWRRSGYLTVTDGEVTDYDQIEESILDDCVRFDVQEVAYDPFQATQLSSHLVEHGVPMVEMRPTVLNFSEPMKELEARILSGRLKHNGCPVLTWMISNVVCHRDQKDNIYPRRERVENKIDGAVAAIMAIGRWMQQASQTEQPAYIAL